MDLFCGVRPWAAKLNISHLWTHITNPGLWIEETLRALWMSIKCLIVPVKDITICAEEGKCALEVWFKPIRIKPPVCLHLQCLCWRLSDLSAVTEFSSSDAWGWCAMGPLLSRTSAKPLNSLLASTHMWVAVIEMKKLYSMQHGTFWVIALQSTEDCFRTCVLQVWGVVSAKVNFCLTVIQGKNENPLAHVKAYLC